MSKKAELKMIDPDDLVIVGLDTNDGPDHELYDERALEPLDEALVKNVSVYGVLQPVTVREQGGQLFVVDGRQRVRAARSARNQQSKAGEFEIRVPYTTHGAEGADRQQLTGIMVSANEQRRADEVLVKAAKAARMKALGASLDEVAIAFGRSTVTIRNWLSLLEADDAVLDAVRDGTCAVSAANEIVKYPKEEQADVLNTLLGQTKNGRVTESMAKGFRQLGGDSTASSDSQAKATANAGPHEGAAGPDWDQAHVAAQGPEDAGGSEPHRRAESCPRVDFCGHVRRLQLVRRVPVQGRKGTEQVATSFTRSPRARVRAQPTTGRKELNDASIPTRRWRVDRPIPRVRHVPRARPHRGVCSYETPRSH
jgi:ParB family chromosome partitioning protein